MFLRRSWVMGRGGEIFSSSSAMALASKSPTQMGSERLSSSSPRMSMGMLESGSSASPLTFISSHMVRLLVRAGGPDMDPCSPPSTLLSSSHTLRQRNRRQGFSGFLHHEIGVLHLPSHCGDPVFEGLTALGESLMVRAAPLPREVVSSYAATAAKSSRPASG